MLYSVIPTMLFETEDLVTLADKGIQYEEGTQNIGKVKVPCYKFMNITETQVFDLLESRQLNESEEQEKASFANRASAVLFLQLRKVNMIKDPEKKVVAVTSLTASVMALAAINSRVAQRFLSLVRALS